MTPPALIREPVPAGENCARCDRPMLLVPDAIGRARKRCPKCDGISTNARHHLDDAFVPQTLVRAVQLPVIDAGQLRCQVCARGLEGEARFCVDCNRARRGMTWRKFNELRAPRTRPCPTCGTVWPTVVGRVPKRCESCPPLTKPPRRPGRYADKPCRTCGTTFTPTGPKGLYCPTHRAPAKATAGEVA